MKQLALSVVVLCCLGIGMAGAGLEADEQKPAQKLSEKVTLRLPNNYGKIGLSEEQKQKIYDIRADYRSRIEQLQRELEDLRSQEALEIQTALTPQQREQLQQLLEESRKKRSQKQRP